MSRVGKKTFESRGRSEKRGCNFHSSHCTNSIPATPRPPAARRQKGLENKIFSAFSTRRQSFFETKRKQNIWLQPGTANFFAGPSLSLAADAGAWKSYSYTEQHSPKTSQPLLNCWLQKKSFIFLLPRILTVPKVYFILLIYCFSRSAGGAVRAVPRLRASRCSPQPCQAEPQGLTPGFLIQSQS